jgi:predicted transglutaminase-like cysteine proteinase
MGDLKETLRSIHNTVFHNFEYKTDLEQYQTLEKWVAPPEYYNGTRTIVGDCEDFALACRMLCRAEGIDNSRLVVCNTEIGEGHCVLEVEGWVLDNRMRQVVTRDELSRLGYKWVAISGYNPKDKWFRLKE